ncbi:SPOR domain-containing protein [Orbus mooreae]|uniref:SPOR domain-containing protein n=1 Tax=Orbus mooreae TaxID=3074107 RepID=UPI00370D257F
MNNKKRNQLIGFTVLLLFILCIGPYIITDKSMRVESTIPLLPTNDNQLIEYTDDSVNSSAVFTPEDEFNSDHSSIIHQEPTPIVEPQIDNSNPQNRKNYVVQLVALKNKQKIEELVALLRLNNYDVYTEPQIPQEGQVTRLFVGYYPTKEQADIVIMDLEHLTKLKGFAVTK